MHLLYPNPTSVKFMGQCQVPEQAYIKAGLPPYLKGGWAKSGSLSSAKLNPSECIFGLAFFWISLALALQHFGPISQSCGWFANLFSQHGKLLVLWSRGEQGGLGRGAYRSRSRSRVDASHRYRYRAFVPWISRDPPTNASRRMSNCRGVGSKLHPSTVPAASAAVPAVPAVPASIQRGSSWTSAYGCWSAHAGG